MSKFHVGQKVRLLWEKTPYDSEGFLEVGVVTRLPSHDDDALDDRRFYDVIGVNPNEPDKAYKFFAHEMVELIGPTLNGDTL